MVISIIVLRTRRLCGKDCTSPVPFYEELRLRVGKGFRLRLFTCRYFYSLGSVIRFEDRGDSPPMDNYCVTTDWLFLEHL